MSDDTQKRADVGYGRPPAERQFRKGISGNPRGRPPKVRSLSPRQFRRDVLEVADMTTSIQTSKGRKRVTFAQALIFITAQRAAKGDRPCLRMFMDWYIASLNAHSQAHEEHFKFLELMEREMTLQPEKHQSEDDQRMLAEARKKTRRP